MATNRRCVAAPTAAPDKGKVKARVPVVARPANPATTTMAAKWDHLPAGRADADPAEIGWAVRRRPVTIWMPPAMGPMTMPTARAAVAPVASRVQEAGRADDRVGPDKVALDKAAPCRAGQVRGAARVLDRARPAGAANTVNREGVAKWVAKAAPAASEDPAVARAAPARRRWPRTT